MTELIGATLGPYVVTGRLGSGGHGSVYRARHRFLNTERAIKILSPQLARDSNFVGRFVREARVLSGLEHPNIVRLHDFGDQQDVFYLVMDLVTGETLKAILASRRPSLDESLALLRQIATAVDYLHQRGVAHRDLKPANLIVGDTGHLTIVDFGISADPTQSRITNAGAILGTVQYLAPEAVSGSGGLTQDDYAVGVVAYELLTGRPPFTITSLPGMVAAHRNNVPPLPARALRPDLSPAIESVLHRQLAKQPADRYSSLAAFVDALTPPVVASSPLPATLVAPPVTVVGPPVSSTMVAPPVPNATFEVPAFTKPPPVATPSRQGPPLWLILAFAGGALAVVLMLLVVAGSALVLARAQPTATRTAVAQATPTVSPATTTPAPANPTVAPPAAVPQPTSRPVPTTIPVGQAVFLENFQSSNRWPTGTEGSLTGQFTSRGYELTVTDRDIWWVWNTNTDYESFIYEADLEVIDADDAIANYGLVFRFWNGDGYHFRIASDGRFKLSRWIGSLRGYDDVTEWIASAAIRPNKATNRLKVAARGPDFTLYINDQHVLDVRETKAGVNTHGSVGLMLGGNITIVAKAARVFALG